jgi:anthranilate phosphoribosyltransferase
MVIPPGPTWPGVLSSLVAGNDLDAETANWAMSQILAGEASDVQIAGFAVALRSKGESVSEISGLASAMLEVARPITVPNPAVDIVGSGGDRSNTVNISTMAAVVAASAGARVVKHGNRALGVRLDLSPEDQQRVIERIGIGFLFAPHYHGSLRNTASARSQLGIATTFNFLGPLTNPGRPNAHAVGVADERMAELSARVLAERGDQGLVFHGTDGLDELTTTSTSTVFVFDGDTITRTVLDPRDLGIPAASVSELVGGGPADNAAIARRVFSGEPGPIRDIVLLNAAAALAAFDGPGPADTLQETLAVRLQRAAEAIDSGATAELLDRWIAATA